MMDTYKYKNILCLYEMMRSIQKNILYLYKLTVAIIL